jgi:hypothetical protein
MNKKLAVWDRFEAYCRTVAQRTARRAPVLLLASIPLFGALAVTMTGVALWVADSERSKLFLSIAAYLGGLAAFSIGLIQYRRADYWRRSEFLAREMKEFFADPKVGSTMTMIDWGVRRIKLFEATASKELSIPDSGIRRINRSIQCAALRPHTMPRPESLAFASSRPIRPTSSDEVATTDQVEDEREPTEDLAKIGPLRFSLKEAAIRDCYDRFLDGLDRLGNYLAGDLVTVEDLEPYLGYWLWDIASSQCSADDALWTLFLWAYIDFYSFDGVFRLFKAFGHNISIDSEVAAGLVGHCSDPAAAHNLLSLVRESRHSRIDELPPSLANA